MATDLWEVLGGRAIGTPVGPEDPDLWDRVVERLNPARARPRLRDGVEAVARTSVRGQPYVMLRSPDRLAGYVRLTPQEWDLARLMDGDTTVASLVGAFARATGSLAPDRVVRVVADLAANRMLHELPVDAFATVATVTRGSGVRRFGSRLWSVLRGRRVVLGDIDRLSGWLYRAGGWLLFTRAFAGLAAVAIVAGLVLFVRTWARGTNAVFLTDGSYAVGGLVLLGLNALALLAHEFGHALATKHAGRRVPAVGLLFYFGIPSAFVDTTDIWMADRRHRLLATAAGPLSALTLAGVAQVVALVQPSLGGLAFKLAFAWYLNALFNLNPLMALDGYYLAMDALEIPNLRARGIRWLLMAVRGRRFRVRGLDREQQYVAAYGVASVLWMVAFLALMSRMWRDRVNGLVAGLWHTGWVGRALVVAFVVGLLAPLVALVRDGVTRWWARRRAAREAADHAADGPRRRALLAASVFADLPAESLDALAAASTVRPGVTAVQQPADSAVADVLLVVDGTLEARRPGDPPGATRDLARAGEAVGVPEVAAGRAAVLEWRPSPEATLLAIPAAAFVEVTGGALVGRRDGAPSEVEAAVHALDAAPALAWLSSSARTALLAGMSSVDVPPGKRITLKDAAHGMLVGSGQLEVDGTGEVLQVGDVLHALDSAPVSAVTRTRSVVWRLRDLGGLPPPGVRAAGAPAAGVHGGAGGHPPVVPPPAPDGTGGDDEADDRLWRRTKRALVLLLLFALLSIATALREPTPWAETAHGTLLLEVVDGTAEVLAEPTEGQSPSMLREGSRMVVAEGAWIRVARRSTVSLTAHGGARQLLCGGTEATLGTIAAVDGEDEEHEPAARLVLARGAVLADTDSPFPGWAPVVLEVDTGPVVRSAGVAEFAVTGEVLDVTSGEVEVVVAGIVAGEVECRGDGIIAAPGGRARRPAPTEPAPTPSPDAEPSHGTVTPSPSPVGTAPPSASPSSTPSTAPDPSPSSAPSPSPSPSPSPLPSPSPSPTPTLAFVWRCTDPDPGTLANSPAASTTSTCTATSTNEVGGTVAVSCDVGSYPGTCTPGQSSLDVPAGGSAQVVMTIGVPEGTTPDSYAVDAIAAHASGTTLSDDLPFSVTAAPDFEWVSCTDAPDVAGRTGGTSTSRCQLRSLHGFSGTVQVSCSTGLRSVTCAPSSGSPASVTLGAGGTAHVSITFTVGGGTSPGTYTGTVRGESGGIVRTIAVPVTVT